MTGWLQIPSNEDCASTMHSFRQQPPDTITAISTPPGRGGIGIVRLSGANSREIAEPFLRLGSALAAGRARFGEVLDSATGEPLDEVVVTYFAGPHSATGEDVVEIAAHGSPVLLERILRQCVEGGARLAEPGEFTQRAFLSGRIDLTQAEAIHDLIQASTLHQARVAAQQMGGGLSRVLAPIKAGLVALIAKLEAGIDFAEDDLETSPAEEIVREIEALGVPLEGLERSFAYGRLVREGFRLAIVGRPNAGKSSLFNKLVERERAIVTPAAGTTRDLITERIAVEGIPLELVDTAGLREAMDEAESMGIAKSHEAMAEADLVLVVVDAAQPAREETASLLQRLEGRAVLVVENKCDLLGPAARAGSGEDAPQGIRTSALTGEGIPELRQAILRQVSGQAPAGETAVVTNLRQQQAIGTALASLRQGRAAAEMQVPHEMVLIDLYETLRALDSLTGATSTEDILRLIFSTFCIGK